MSLLSFAKKIAGRRTATRAPQKKTEKDAGSLSAAPKSTVASTIVHTGALGLRPLITEESVVMHGDQQTIAFRVRPDAHKPAIAKAVQAHFGVEPVSIRILHVRGKNRRRGQSMGASPAWKKAYVTLPVGKSIDFTA